MKAFLVFDARGGGEGAGDRVVEEEVDEVFGGSCRDWGEFVGHRCLKLGVLCVPS